MGTPWCAVPKPNSRSLLRTSARKRRAGKRPRIGCSNARVPRDSRCSRAARGRTQLRDAGRGCDTTDAADQSSLPRSRNRYEGSEAVQRASSSKVDQTAQRAWRAKSCRDARSSRPHSTRSTDPKTRLRIIQLRKQWLTIRQIAKVVGVSPSTVARVCRGAGLSRLKQLDAPPAPTRYERERAGELIHVDIKRLGRFDRPGHRVTRRRSYGSRKQGFEFLHVATDDASRATYAEILPDECAESAVTFLTNAVAWFARVGVTVERVMTDNGSAYVSRRFGQLCNKINVRHKRIRPHRPQTNGKVERMIQTCFVNGRTAFVTAHPPKGSSGSFRISTSTMCTELTPLFHTMRRSVASQGRTS